MIDNVVSKYLLTEKSKKVGNLSVDQRGFLAAMLNYYGSGGPVADEKSLAYFEDEYIGKILTQATGDNKLSSAGKGMAQELQKVFK